MENPLLDLALRPRLRGRPHHARLRPEVSDHSHEPGSIVEAEVDLERRERRLSYHSRDFIGNRSHLTVEPIEQHHSRHSLRGAAPGSEDLLRTAARLARRPAPKQPIVQLPDLEPVDIERVGRFDHGGHRREAKSRAPRGESPLRGRRRSGQGRRTSISPSTSRGASGRLRNTRGSPRALSACRALSRIALS